jgi:hypothetical protein
MNEPLFVMKRPPSTTEDVYKNGVVLFYLCLFMFVCPGLWTIWNMFLSIMDWRFDLIKQPASIALCFGSFLAMLWVGDKNEEMGEELGE